MRFYPLMQQIDPKTAAIKNVILGYFSVSFDIYPRNLTIVCS